MNESMTVEEASLTPSPSDEQHKKQDEEVTLTALEHIAKEQQLSNPDCVFLLREIIKCSGGKLQDAFMDDDKAIKLMREKPKLKSALQKAWKTKDYKEIRELDELRALPPPMDEPMPVEEAFLTPSPSDNFTDPQHKQKNEEVTLAALSVFGKKEKQLSEYVECAVKEIWESGELRASSLAGG
ncbi:hypothetical protein M378DRAFT_166489 [Amanita muscaria Koide BX008]|uniref:Uncharacterized protein n=1 Tax=Amanita muscaria (strain Koide BX008) TaxID=946122 RepID=A0A0C2T565_AMAMK|nr:hypothetical protein M378DRAFT_166489 [Amanita muscaria Koide BX008]